MYGLGTDISRLHTALAQFIACSLFITLLPKRFKWYISVPLVFVFWEGIITPNYLSDNTSVFWWIPLMILICIIMFLYIFTICKVNVTTAVYYWAWAFVVAEFSSSLEWQINNYIFPYEENRFAISVLLSAIAIYTVFFGVYFLWERSRRKNGNDVTVKKADTLSAVLIAIASFSISNLNLAWKNAAFSVSVSTAVNYVRTLISFAGLLMLYAHDMQMRKNELDNEVRMMDSIIHKQYDEYQHFRDSSREVAKMHHDLKHQIEAMKLETSEEKKSMRIQNMEQVIRQFESDVKTGSPVLDPLIAGKKRSCFDKGIQMTVRVDGELLDFMDIVDMCTIFGNAIDNAIEATENIKEAGKRVIKISCYSQMSMIMVKFENYYDSIPQVKDGEFLTTKSEKAFHGYGLKSIRSLTEKYGGHVTIEAENNWFTLMLLLPIHPKK